MSEVSATEPETVLQVAVSGRRPVWLSWTGIGVRGTTGQYLLALLGLWAAELLVLFVLQQLGTGFGLRIRQMGEDRVWTYMFQFNGLSGVPKAFWLINDRNPLSPWWYLAFQPLIAASPYGIFLVRKIIDLLCASSAFLLVDRLGHGRLRLFAMSVAVITLFWNFSGYGDQIMWDFLGALALSALTIWMYCKYLDSGRRSSAYLAISLVLYFVAICTYTLQATSFVGVFALALFRGQQWEASPRRWLSRISQAVLDTGYYVALFAVYTMMWYTAARPSSDYYALSLSLLRTQFIESVKYLFWHYDYPKLLAEVRDQWALPALLIVGAASFVGFAVLFLQSARADERHWSHQAPSAWTRSQLSVVGYGFAVAAGLAMATVALEATSSVWVPGLRARMIQQIFQPLLYLSLLFGALALAFRRQGRVARWSAVVGAAVMATLTLVVSLQYNRDLNQNSAIEERFETGLKAIVPQPLDRTKFIVRMNPGIWHNSDSLSDSYIQTFYKSKLVNMRVLQPGAPVAHWEDYSTVIFGPDDKGVQMGDSGATAPEWVPYSQIRIVSFDGDTVSLLPSVAPTDMLGYRVGFDRSEPLLQRTSANPSASIPVATDCAYSVRITEPITGTGWSVPEHTPDGLRAFQWMASSVATVAMPFTCNDAATVQLHAMNAMSADILSSLSLSFDGSPVTLASSSDATGTLITAKLTPEQVRAGNGAHQLKLGVARTIVPAGGDRTLAVAFDRIQVVPSRSVSAP